MERDSEASMQEEGGARDEQQQYAAGPDENVPEPTPRRPGLFKRLCTKAGLDLPTFLMMLK